MERTSEAERRRKQKIRQKRRRKRKILKLIRLLMTVLIILLFVLILRSLFLGKTKEDKKPPEKDVPAVQQNQTPEPEPEPEDTEPPVIEGVEELFVPQGASVSYKRNVTVTDNADENVKLEVDADQVDLNTIGDYEVVYRAVDSAGNETQISTVIHVEKPSAENATEDSVNAEADKVLAQITTADMDEYEKAKAIFWVHENIGYLDGTPKTNWVEGAYHGLVERQGDCYVYFATAKCLLTRAGIKNMDIEKIPTKTRHYWNLIDLGDGWYHYDTTRRKDKTYFFYTSDEELMKYSRTHHDSHRYDPEQYPQIQ